jgi:hypothetical protein
LKRTSPSSVVEAGGIRQTEKRLPAHQIDYPGAGFEKNHYNTLRLQ